MALKKPSKTRHGKREKNPPARNGCFGHAKYRPPLDTKAWKERCRQRKELKKMEWNQIISEVCKREGGKEQLNAVEVGEAISNYNKLVEEKTSIKVLEVMKRVK